MVNTRQRQIGTIIAILNGIAILIAILLSFYNIAIAWSLGLAFGFVFQRSRFCTVAAIRDIFLLQNFSMAKGVLLYLGLATGIFGLLYSISLHSSLEIGSKIEPVGLLTIVGAFLFGIGMVIAGGCASGTLIRMGEGLVMQWWGFLGILFGLLIGSWSMPKYIEYNYGFKQLFLPDQFGLVGALFIQIFIIVSIYYMFRWVEQKNQYDDNYVKATASQTAATKADMGERILRPWSYMWGAVSLALLTSLVFLWKQTWGITSGLTHLFAGLTNVFVMDVSHWYAFTRLTNQNAIFLKHPLVPLVIAMIVGSLISALLAREFRIRKVAHGRFIVSALLGGFLMGLGARMANGCNVSAVMSGIPSLSLHGWVFLIFMTLGVLVGIRILTRYLVS